jgi:hypothetical protein
MAFGTSFARLRRDQERLVPTRELPGCLSGFHLRFTLQAVELLAVYHGKHNGSMISHGLTPRGKVAGSVEGVDIMRWRDLRQS